MDDSSTRPSFPRAVAGLVLFGLTFGYVEGAVVVYLRALYEPLQQKLRPDGSPGDLFPLIRIEELRKEGPEHVHRLVVELAREAATLIMLAAVPLTFARNVRQWIAGYMIGFGVWDLMYYATLKLLLGWPDSLLTWDILFLIPVPWSGPVLAPCLVSISIICAGVIILHREAIGRPIPIRAGHWTGIVVGGSIVILSFCWDARSVASGAMPGPFPWAVFAFGELLGLVVFGSLLGRTTMIPKSDGWVKRRGLLMIVGLAGLLMMVALSRREVTASRATPIVLDDFAFKVVDVRRSDSPGPKDGARSGPGRSLIVSLEVRNQAKRVTYLFDPRKVLVLDDRGREYRIDPTEQRTLDESNSSRSTRRPPIPAGESATFDLIFSVPPDFAHPRLSITAGDPVGDFLEGLTAGTQRVSLER